MKLQKLLQGLDEYHGPDCDISGLSLNSKQVQPGDLFIAIKGQSFDGRVYIPEAIAKGASAIICSVEGDEFRSDFSHPIPIIPVRNLTKKLDILAKKFYEDPSKELPIVGITGTNGKTTCSFLLAQSLHRLHIRCAILGTLGYGFVGNLSQSALTTPDVVSLQKYFKELKDKGAQAVAMEVSSHGLAQGRVNSINFNSAIFTNLTQDHLDYHGNMEAYGNAKQKLFQFPSLQRAILNADSPFTEKCLRVIRSDLPITLYSVKNQPPHFPHFKHSRISSLYVKQFDFDQKGLRALVRTPWGEGELRSSLLGHFNLSNLLCVLAELCLREIKLSDALEALSQAMPAPGRMQRLGGVRTPQVIIDYAHTPDALANALKAARAHCRRRLWCVFGCGGDRDKDKRAKMGNIAGYFADKVVLTNDNPRTENPTKIIEDILQGLIVDYSDKVIIEEDRAKAIQHAIHHALEVDTILIAGKGHEDYQIIGDQRRSFSDVACVNAILNEDNNNEAMVYS